MSKEHQGGMPRTAIEDGRIVRVQEPEIVYDESWEEIGDNMTCEQEGSKLYGDYDYRLLARFLMQWIHQDGNSNPEGVKTRAYVVCFFICPEIYENASATAMADEAGVTRAAFNKWVSKFRDQFDFILPTMKSEEARDSYRFKIDRSKMEFTDGAGI